MSSPPRSNRMQTPAGYHTSTFPLPPLKYVGILCCQRDPMLMSFDSKVISCIKVEQNQSQSLPKIKGKAAVVPKAAEEWEIQLEDTIVFPMGGGQHSDHATMQSLSRPSGDPVIVLDAQRRGIQAIHICDKPCEVGESVKIEIDVERRLDQMSQHTGQHLISALLDEIDIPTVAWCLSPYPAPSYVEITRQPTLAEIEAIQTKANEIIWEDLPIKVTVSKGERGDKMPEDYDTQAGVVRVVEIGNIDRNPCCGTHFPSTAPLQTIFILPQTTSIRTTNVRLYFLIGSRRVLSYLNTMEATVRSSSLTLSCSTQQVADRIKSTFENYKDVVKREKDRREEMARFIARDVFHSALSQLEKNGGKYIGYLKREEDSTNDLDFLTLVATILLSLLPASSITGPHCFTLITVASSQAPEPTGSILIIGNEIAATVKSVVDILGDKVKGGGKGRWQGRIKGRIDGDAWRKIEEALSIS